MQSPLKVISVDVNPCAFQHLRENIRLNRAEKTVVPIQGDAKKITENRLQNAVDRVLMPLPERAYEYLDYALLALKPAGGWIHYYDFEYANKNEDPVEKTKKKVSEKLLGLCSEFQVEFGRIVRPIGPDGSRWFLTFKYKTSLRRCSSQIAYNRSYKLVYTFFVYHDRKLRKPRHFHYGCINKRVEHRS